MPNSKFFWLSKQFLSTCLFASAVDFDLAKTEVCGLDGETTPRRS